MPASDTPEADSGFPVELPRRLFVRRKRLSAVAIEQPRGKELAARMCRFDMFAHLPEAILGRLAAQARVEMFHAGDLLWRQGEASHRVLFIERGMAKTSRRVRDGVHRTYGLYGPGDSMGIHAIWAGMRYPTDAVVLNEGMMSIILPPEALVECAERCARIVEPLMTEIGRFTESFIRKIEIVSAGTAAQRIAALLNGLLERYGNTGADGIAHLPIHLPQELIAEVVDARIETVARIINRWKRLGWILFDQDGCHFPRPDWQDRVHGDQHRPGDTFQQVSP